MGLLRYISHPQVQIDPDVPVPKWSLSDRGAERAKAMLAQPWVNQIGHVISSDETKARETAAFLVNHLGLALDARPATDEIDRSSTGYVPHDRHEELANQLFAHPEQSADGWERAVDAQKRMIASLYDVLALTDSDATDIAVVGHGGVGTLLMCHLGGLEISRSHDQPGGGHYWTFDRSNRALLHRWRAIDDLEATP